MTQRAKKHRGKVLLTLDVAGMSWYQTIEVREVPPSRTGVYFTGLAGDEEGDDKTLDDFCLGFISRKDLIRSLASLLHNASNRFKHTGRGITASPCSAGEKALLDVCWCDDDNEPEWRDVAEFLLLLDSAELEVCHTAFPNWEPDFFKEFVDLFINLNQKVSIDRLKQEHGPIQDESWFQRAFSSLEALREEEHKEEAEQVRLQNKAHRQMAVDFPTPESIVNRFADKIPCEHLTYALELPRPEPGEVTDALLLCWGELTPTDAWNNRDCQKAEGGVLTWISANGADVEPVRRLASLSGRAATQTLNKIANDIVRLEDQLVVKPTGLFSGMAYTSRKKSYAFYSQFKQIPAIQALLDSKRAESLRIFGAPEDISNLAGIAQRFGTKIPPGYLVHSTRFWPPSIGPLTDIYLMSWARWKRLPVRTNETWDWNHPPSAALWDAVQEGEAFLRWISSEGARIEVIRRLQDINNPLCKKCFEKIAERILELKRKLNRKDDPNSFYYKRSLKFYSQFKELAGIADLLNVKHAVKS